MNNSQRLGPLAASLLLLNLFSTSADAVAVSGQGTWETTLQARDLDGNTGSIEAYYDTDLNITWLADANNAGTTMDWTTANSWAAALNIDGTTGWRLPAVTDTGTPGCNFANTGTDCGYNVDTATGEMAHMFYVTLGNKAAFDTLGNPQSGSGLSNTGPFSNAQNGGYWSATELATDTSKAWGDSFNDGKQDVGSKTYLGYAWAVHSGDVGTATVPLPAAVWLFGGGLLGLIGIARRKKWA